MFRKKMDNPNWEPRAIDGEKIYKEMFCIRCKKFRLHKRRLATLKPWRCKVCKKPIHLVDERAGKYKG